MTWHNDEKCSQYFPGLFFFFSKLHAEKEVMIEIAGNDVLVVGSNRMYSMHIE